MTPNPNKSSIQEINTVQQPLLIRSGRDPDASSVRQGQRVPSVLVCSTHIHTRAYKYTHAHIHIYSI